LGRVLDPVYNGQSLVWHPPEPTKQTLSPFRIEVTASSRSINLPVREPASFVMTFEAFDSSPRRLGERSDRPLEWSGSQPLPRQEKGKLPGAAIPAG
jgi:hypothetical protein